MKCPNCDSLQDKVLDSRLKAGALYIRRRRECQDCGHRWTTIELEIFKKSPLKTIKIVKAVDKIEKLIKELNQEIKGEI